MIVGSADPARLAAGRPRLASLHPEPLTLPDALVLQAFFEMPQAVRECLLPPALHPTNPAGLMLWGWRCPSSPFGPFSLVMARLQCRSGLRPRGYAVGGLCDAPAAAAALRAGFGFALAPGEIRWRRGYDALELEAFRDGERALAFRGEDPDPLDPRDVQYSTTLNLAETPRGLRLVQVDVGFEGRRAERLRPRLAAFAGAAFGEARLDPYHPVSASVATADIHLPALRFLCRPEVLAFEGTEAVGPPEDRP